MKRKTQVAHGNYIPQLTINIELRHQALQLHSFSQPAEGEAPLASVDPSCIKRTNSLITARYSIGMLTRYV